MNTFYATFAEELRAEPNHVFTGCVFCGRELHRYDQQNGLCNDCTGDMPIPFEVTHAAIVALAQGKAADPLCDECGCPPAVCMCGQYEEPTGCYPGAGSIAL